MNKIIVGLLLVCSFLLGGLFTKKVLADKNKDLAWTYEIANTDIQYSGVDDSKFGVSRFEWYGDVCYTYRQGGISCLKK